MANFGCGLRVEYIISNKQLANGAIMTAPRKKLNVLYPIAFATVAAVGILTSVALGSIDSIRKTQDARQSALITEDAGYIDKKLVEAGRGWILSQDTITHSRVDCVYEKDVPKAQKDIDDYNESFNATVYGKNKLTSCILKDGATTAELETEVLKQLGLTQDYSIGAIRQLDRGGFTEGSYFVTTVHVMSKKAS
jgi:hypothetical protein